MNHFNLPLPSLPTFRFSYQSISTFSSKTCILAFPATKLHTSFSSSSDNFIAYLLLQITLLCAFTHRFYSSFHFIHQAFAILSFTYISFQFSTHHSHATNKHSNSFSIISFSNAQKFQCLNCRKSKPAVNSSLVIV